MSKVYVVTSGSYSDYGINAIFSTRKAAQVYIDDALKAKRAEGYGYIGNTYWADEANIEEWELNGDRKATVHTRWHVGLFQDTGVVIEHLRPYQEFGIKHNGTSERVAVPIHNSRVVVRAESCKSGEHAMKLAVEARQAALREVAQ